MGRGASVYLVTRTHGLKTHLITSRDMQTLARARSLRDISDTLLKTDYAADLAQLPEREHDAPTLERVFLKKLVERFYFVRLSAQGKMKDVLTRYCARFEIENIKRIIRAKHGGQTGEQPNLVPLEREHTLVNFPALLQAKNVDEVASLLRDTQYQSLLEKLQPYKESETTMILESALDKIYFTRIWRAVGTIRGTRNLIGEEIDLRNLLTVLSLKMRGVSARLIEETIIPISYSLPKSLMQSLIQSRIEEAPTIFPRAYSELASEAASVLKTGSPLLLERVFFKHLYSAAVEASMAHPLQAEYVIGYLLLCEAEAKNLVTIVTGKRLNLSQEQIAQSLFGLRPT
jgi:vacuolar-type H+-ATPase subunit C/Vma6